MTVIADNKKRVTLPTSPGERFDVQAFGGDKFVLTRLAPVELRPAKIVFKKIKVKHFLKPISRKKKGESNARNRPSSSKYFFPSTLAMLC